MKKRRHGYFPDDCWEFIFQKLREDDERDLDSISLVSKRFLSISNWVKLSLNVNDETLPLLPILLRRFRNIETLVITVSWEIDGLVDLISRSGVLNLQAVKFCWGSPKPPRDGFKALALNKNIKNHVKVLDCTHMVFMRDNDLVSIADCFPRLEELKIRAYKLIMGNGEVAGRITDDGVDALASKLKELKKIVFKGGAFFITDKSLISLSANCVKLRTINLNLGGQHRVTEDGIGFVMHHSPNLTTLSLNLGLLTPFAFSFTPENTFTNAKNLHSLTMYQQLVSAKHICLVAKASPPLKKLKLVGLNGQYPELHGALNSLLQACQVTLKELTLRNWQITDTYIGNLAQYLSNLTFIDVKGCFGFTSVTFYTLMKSCPLLEILKMTHTSGQEMDTFSADYVLINYRIRHLDISKNMWLTDQTLKNFGQVCPNLQFLDVSDCSYLTNSGIGEVLRRCPAITQLNINGLSVSNIFGSYFDHSVVNLKTLRAKATQLNDKGMAMIGSRCRYLQYLDIERCCKVTDRGVMEVVRNCKRLRDILLGGCGEVSPNILPEMVLSRPSLRNIKPPPEDGIELH
ncbi:hypothetical protein RHSIM_Rhsim01G0029400 [Rhododendron simsii]|uniref:F-box/LRR-repeat protein 15-like leucin rich repeat domain-containing protein n=1 Tax=Rhododendron simsii TaxID=118357 RepID=A0A834HGV0_RHOSS|nr:hypothetical protein RHSIM_Rhsim01G0029400 [Rhododendron simsii]